MTDVRALGVTFVDVGQGDATIVVPPPGEGDPIVFDAGADGWEVAQQLRTWKVTRLEAVIASHLDLDHIGGLATVLDAVEQVGAVYFSADRDITDDHTDAVRAKALADTVMTGDGARWQLREVHRDARAVAVGDRGDWSVHVLAPKASVRAQQQRTGKWEEANRYSAVLRVQMAGRALLVGADAPLRTWSELPADELESRVFRIPHHGGAIDDGGVPDGWSAAVLYDRVKPHTAVISVGTHNKHGHPSLDWVDPLIGRKGCRLLCSQVTGECHPAFAKDAPGRDEAIRKERERVLPAPYRDDSHFAEPPFRHYTQRKTEPYLETRQGRLEVPCAGTISVRMDENGEVLVDPIPEHTSLAARIGRWDAALCRRDGE